MRKINKSTFGFDYVEDNLLTKQAGDAKRLVNSAKNFVRGGNCRMKTALSLLEILQYSRWEQGNYIIKIELKFIEKPWLK